MSVVLLAGGLVCLFVGGDALVRGAVALGRHFDLSPLVIGVFIVGFGTSIPELVFCIGASLSGHPAMAVGNVIGSNISNVLLVLGLIAVFWPVDRPDKPGVAQGFILIAVSASVMVVGLQVTVPAWQGLAMLACLAVLIGAEYTQARRSVRARREATEAKPVPKEIPRRPLVSVLLAATGMAAVLYGADLVVQGATGVARQLEVSEGLIGLTVIAVGTSLPELAGSAMAAWRGHGQVAYGNIVGSNLFNILAALGGAIVVGDVGISPVMMAIDGPAMMAATALMLLFMVTASGISRVRGAVMVTLYAGYIALRFSLGLHV